MTLRASRRGWGLVVFGLLLSACGGKVSSGVGGESHFFCDTDADCSTHAPYLSCIERVCQSDGASRRRTALVGARTGSPDAGTPEPGANVATPQAPVVSTPPTRTTPDAGLINPASADLGAVPQYALAAVPDDGRLVGMYWTGSVFAIVLIDPVTFAPTVVGDFGNLRAAQAGFQYDPASRTAYAIGTDVDGVSGLYAFSFETHQSSSVALHSGRDAGTQPLTLGPMTGAGSLLGAHFTGSGFTTALVDPATAQEQFVGALGNMSSLQSSSFVYDAASRVTYMVGTDGTQNSRLYAESLDTGHTTSVALAVGDSGLRNLVLGAVMTDHRILAAYFAGTSESVVLLDPTTAETTYLGTLGDLYWWSDQLVYDSGAGVVYAQGQSQTGPWQFYSLELPR